MEEIYSTGEEITSDQEEAKKIRMVSNQKNSKSKRRKVQQYNPEELKDEEGDFK